MNQLLTFRPHLAANLQRMILSSMSFEHHNTNFRLFDIKMLFASHKVALEFLFYSSFVFYRLALRSSFLFVDDMYKLLLTNLQ